MEGFKQIVQQDILALVQQICNMYNDEQIDGQLVESIANKYGISITSDFEIKVNE